MYPYLKRRDLADVIKIKDAEITEIILNYLVVYVCSFSCVQFLATLWIIACQAPLPMVLSRQECWNGLPFPPLEDIRNPGIEPQSPVLADRFFTAEPFRSCLIGLSLIM